MYVLYKLSLQQYKFMDDGHADILFAYRHKLLSLSLDVLMKSQSDDVRLNCLGGFFLVHCCLLIYELYTQYFAFIYSTHIPILSMSHLP